MTHVIPVGTSEPQDFALKNDGVALVGTGFTVGLEIYQRVNGAFEELGSPAPSVAWLSQAAGTVRVTGVEVLEIGSYAVRYSITDGAGTVAFVPNGGASDTWRVVSIPTK